MSYKRFAEEDKQLLAILRRSLWGDTETSKKDVPVITPSIRCELQAQTVEGLTAIAYPDRQNQRYALIAKFVQMASVQKEVVRIIQEAGIPVVVMKGTAAGIYYPYPYLRTYGDIDLLVHPDNYLRAISILQDAGCKQIGEIGHYHTAYIQNEEIIELHQSPPDLEDVKEGEYILQYLLAGLDDIQQGVIEQTRCEFPILPWRQNGLELIWHIREHLYNGLGLRQIIDWMLFADRYLDDVAFAEYKEVLQKAGLLTLAINVTRLCQIYLGLKNTITWCGDADKDTCADLLQFILEQGNFGIKQQDDKAAKVLTRYNTPIAFLIGMQRKGLKTWEPARKHVILRPFAWIHIAVQGIKRYTGEGWRDRLHRDREEKRERQELFKRIYGKEITSGITVHGEAKTQRTISSDISDSTASTISCDSDATTWRSPGELKLKKIYYFVRRTPLRIPLYYVNDWYYICRSRLMGRPEITEIDRENVERNVTFIYKSFNRKKQAIRLYRSIKSYYPNARVVIADDSQIPLHIEGMADIDGSKCVYINTSTDNTNPKKEEKEFRDTIIHLPFNSGLSIGLNAAIEQVKTPFTMRMDDDELLTPGSRVHEQLAFLQKHAREGSLETEDDVNNNANRHSESTMPRIDLVGVQATDRNPERMAAYFRNIKMRKRLLVPVGTKIDGREVVYKTPNVFLIRTEALRKVGYDPNIRMIDHHEFFYRAAGVIVSVQDPHAYIMHCHNYFEKLQYTKYRGDVAGDASYIAKKHGKEYG